MLKYIGNGNFLIGVPARDLTAEEAEKYGGAEALIATGLYEKAAKMPGKMSKPAGKETEVKDAT